MNTDGAAEVVRFVVIGEYGAAVAVASQGLGGKKGGRGNVSEGAGFSRFIGCAEALGGVLDQCETVLFADGRDCVIITRVPQNIHRNHSLWNQPALCQDSSDLPLQAGGGQIVGIRRDVAENRGSPQHLCRLRGGDKRHVRTEHRISFPYPGNHKGNLKRVRTVGAGNTVPAAHKGGQLSLQFFDVGAADKLGRIQDALNVGVDFAFQGLVLGLQVNKLHWSYFLFVFKDSKAPFNSFSE